MSRKLLRSRTVGDEVGRGRDKVRHSDTKKMTHRVDAADLVQKSAGVDEAVLQIEAPMVCDAPSHAGAARISVGHLLFRIGEGRPDGARMIVPKTCRKNC